LFVAIVRAGSINEAARREHNATSAVSRRIGELEAMLGVKLLRRLPRGVEPTEEGAIFARYGEKLLGDLNHLSNELRDFNAGEKGKIYLATVTSAILTGLPSFLADFERDFPHITVDVRELTENLQKLGPVQGNLDPMLLITGGDPMFDETKRILDTLGKGPFIFNLGHGITPETPPEHVGQLVSFIRDYKG
jgi:DNA-binding transcriptional LysR family regulator